MKTISEMLDDRERERRDLRRRNANRRVLWRTVTMLGIAVYLIVMCAVLFHLVTTAIDQTAYRGVQEHLLQW